MNREAPKQADNNIFPPTHTFQRVHGLGEYVEIEGKEELKFIPDPWDDAAYTHIASTSRRIWTRASSRSSSSEAKHSSSPDAVDSTLLSQGSKLQKSINALKKGNDNEESFEARRDAFPELISVIVTNSLKTRESSSATSEEVKTAPTSSRKTPYTYIHT